MRWGIVWTALVLEACAYSPPADLGGNTPTPKDKDGGAPDSGSPLPPWTSGTSEPTDGGEDSGFPPVEGLDGAVPGTCTGAPFLVTGLIATKYTALGGCTGIMGLPTSNEQASLDNVGRFNVFVQGVIVWSPATDAREVHGRIYNRWNVLAKESGVLGYPITDELPTPDGVGRFNVFQKGSVYWSPATDAFEVIGRIRDKYRDMGWEAGSLGYPISAEYAVPTGRRTDFQRGSITWNVANDTFTVTTK